MTEITRELLDAVIEAQGLTSLEHDLAAALRGVLDLRDDATRRGFAEPWVITVSRLDAALAGTQTDDGAGKEPAVTAVPAPSSPDRIEAAKAALWVTEHFPVDENDMRLPHVDHPDFVQMEVMTYASAEAVVAALDAYDREHWPEMIDRAWEFMPEDETVAPARAATKARIEADLRERIAAEILAACRHGMGFADCPCVVTARLVREGQS